MIGASSLKETAMTEKKPSAVVIRFLLNLSTEDPTYLDLPFDSLKQAKRALNDVFSANGALIMLTTRHEVPVLLRTSEVTAAYLMEEAEAEEA
jgi:hypothetical protein